MWWVWLVVIAVLGVAVTIFALLLKIKTLEKYIVEKDQRLIIEKGLIDTHKLTIKKLTKNRDEVMNMVETNKESYLLKIAELTQVIALSGTFLEDQQQLDEITKKEIVKVKKIHEANPDNKELTDEDKKILDSAAGRLAAIYHKL